MLASAKNTQLLLKSSRRIAAAHHEGRRNPSLSGFGVLAIGTVVFAETENIRRRLLKNTALSASLDTAASLDFESFSNEASVRRRQPFSQRPLSLSQSVNFASRHPEHDRTREPCYHLWVISWKVESGSKTTTDKGIAGDEKKKAVRSCNVERGSTCMTKPFRSMLENIWKASRMCTLAMYASSRQHAYESHVGGPDCEKFAPFRFAFEYLTCFFWELEQAFARRTHVLWHVAVVL